MSFTGIYGPMKALHGEHNHPKITDKERFEELANHGDFGIIFKEQAVIEEHQEDGYPRKTWDTLVGFRSYGKDVFDELNIDRLAIGYGDPFKPFWSLVGEVCEPFQFTHSGMDNHWPSTDWYDYEDVDGQFTVGAVYRVVVDNGDISIEKGMVEFTGFSGGDP